MAPTWIAQAINNGMSHPTNKNDEIALWLLAMWDATGNPEYQLRASKWFTYLKNYRMTLEDEWTSGLDGAGDLIWNYWEPAGSWDFIANQAQNALYDNNGIGNTKTWYGLHPNNGYYWIDTQCIVAAFEHGVVFNESDITTLVTDAKTSWTPSSGLGTIQYYFNPSSLLPGMSVSAYPASGTVTQVAGCIPNSLTPAASAAWPSVVWWNGGSYPGALNGTIVSATWNGSTGTIVVQPTGGGANVTLDTNTSTEVWLLRMWSNFVPYDTQIQQEFEANEDTNPATASSWGATNDSYFLWLHSTLTVQSTPPTGVSIGSTLGEGYTTNYTIPGAECSRDRQPPGSGDGPDRVHLRAVDGERNGPDRRPEGLTFAKTEPTTAVAQYVPNYTLTVQSTPPTGSEHRFEHRRRRDDELHGPRDPAGNEREPRGAGDGPDRVHLLAVDGERDGSDCGAEVHHVHDARSDTTAVAQYTLNASTLNVQSTPPTGLSIGSSTGHAGTTNYAMPSVEAGTSVNLQAPATDPTGSYTFAQWTLNGAAQTPGQQSITFTMSAATTAVAQYTLNSGALAVQSTPPTGVFISIEHGQWRDDELRDSRRHAGRQREPRGAGDGPDRVVHLLAMDGERRVAGRRAAVHHVHDVRRDDGRGGVRAGLRADRPVHAADRPGHRFEREQQRHDELHQHRGLRCGREPPGAGDRPDRVHLRAVDGERAAQTAGLKSITFTMTAATTAVAQYTLNTYALNVQSTPPTGLAIGSSTGDGGTTNYAMRALRTARA